MQCMLLSRGILHTRALRRKFILQILIVLIVLFTLGVFVISDWLDANWNIFVIYWGVVFIITIFLMAMALYDALRALKEEKSAHNKEMAEHLRGIAKIMEEEQKRTDKDSS